VREAAVERPNPRATQHGWRDDFSPAGDCGSSDLVAAERPEKAARLAPILRSPFACAENLL
jgi:hypothetical protein